MPLSEESDPFARRHFAGSSGGETVPPWNGASGTRAGCPVRVDQVPPEPVPDGPAPISTGKDRAAHGDDLPDLPGLGGVGLHDEQRTTRPITCPACSFQPDPAAALMTLPPCCPHPCQTYRQRQPPAPRRQPNAGGVRFST